MLKKSLLATFIVACFGIQNADAWIFTKDKIVYTTIDDNTATVSGCASDLTDAVIPASVEYDGKTYAVTSIAAKAFNSNSSLQTLTAAESVTSIGDQAFFLAKKIKEVKMPGLKTLGKEVFYLSTVEKVEFGSALTEISTGCFNAVKSTLSIDLTNIKVIGEKAFMRCKINNVELQGPLTLGKYSFQQAEVVTMKVSVEVTLPTGAAIFDQGKVGTLELCDIHVIDNRSAFNPKVTDLKITQTGSGEIIYGSTPSLSNASTLYLDVDAADLQSPDNFGLTMGELKSLVLGDKVKTVSTNQFYSCTKLTNVKLPANLTSVGASAFGGCTLITSVECAAANPPSCLDNSFADQAYKTATLNVPQGSEDRYAEAVGWKNFVNIKGSLAGVDNVTSTDENKTGDVYDLMGVRVLENATRGQIATLAPGCYIFLGKKIVVR